MLERAPPALRTTDEVSRHADLAVQNTPWIHNLDVQTCEEADISRRRVPRLAATMPAISMSRKSSVLYHTVIFDWPSPRPLLGVAIRAIRYGNNLDPCR